MKHRQRNNDFIQKERKNKIIRRRDIIEGLRDRGYEVEAHISIKME